MGGVIPAQVGITLNVEAVIVGRRQSGIAPRPVDVSLPPAATTVRNLIDAVVRSEVAGYETRAEQRTFVRVLTEHALVDALDQGAVRLGGAEPIAPVDPDGAVATALLAFEDGLYQVHVDGTEVISLDEQVSLTDATRVMFLRLVALAGG